MDPFKILEKYYYTNSKTYAYLVAHSRKVADKALASAGRLKRADIDLAFIEEASLLHDIGIFMVNAPKIGCIGPMEYVAHGYLGREILEKEGYPKHALVCERHVGAGISVEEVEKYNLPLPKRDMLPVSIEEIIICWADKFYSKWPSNIQTEKPLDKVRASVGKYGPEQLKRFDEWQEMFGG
ncbi:MAG TPA: HD domain-containing protein [Nitrospirota bacterium]|nr:HD domain-containing protein [Nitrospirota bacterium]